MRGWLRSVRPLDAVRSIKLKLGLAIVAAVGLSAMVSSLGLLWGIPIWARPIIAAVFALALIQLLARGMTSPLREMADAAQAMSRGDYDRRVSATSRDEVGALARAFNAMAADLAELDRWRRDLVANVSHELRTPITALRATLENMVDGVEAPEPAQLEAMLRQVERLGRLVAQLLDLSRLESGTLALERCTFDVAPLLRDAVREAAANTPATPVVVDVADELAAEGDPERLHQVVANLVANAVRHSPNGEPVRVSARHSDGGLRIEVADRGPGIPPEERSLVFERFYRVDSARSSADGGAGLGLAIAKWIVDLHGGEIRPEVNTPTGCRMVVVVPGGGA